MDQPTARKWIERGLVMPLPETVEIAPEVRPERIAPGVVIHPGCRIRGAETSIGPGCVLGEEAPLTLDNCQLGHRVRLAGGACSGATFLDGAALGSAAHVRPGTLLEEEASCAHAAGLKQTILLPFVTTGSLVNLCDLLIAGGTSRRHHTEVGSSYVHFNFTPHGDKATASLVGDVPRGVWLDQPPIFLGGQGGLVGPSRVAFGVVIPAGIIWRGDALEPETVAVPPPSASPMARPFVAGAYRSVRRIVHANLTFVGNLLALTAWYRHIRARWMQSDPWRAECHAGALRRLAEGVEERLRRLDELADRMERSVQLARSDRRCAIPADLIAEQERFRRQWPAIREAIRSCGDFEPPPELVAAVAGATAREATDWPAVVRAVPDEVRHAGREWLERFVERCRSLWPARTG
ncbi:MAG: UDP-N-acetylglucosamine pyrophosphorylase [Kiritimatiellae bacterium]|nr:UDP-N-acetylglucosamine pyrophosphorylase [Kiritimatiellia bacterium]